MLLLYLFLSLLFRALFLSTLFSCLFPLSFSHTPPCLSSTFFFVCLSLYLSLSLFLSIWLQGEQMALIHNLVKWLTLMRKDIHTERERQQERWRLRKKTRWKPKDSRHVKHSSDRKHLSCKIFKPFMTTNGNKEISGIQHSTLQCALHKPSSILKNWQESTVCIKL